MGRGGPDVEAIFTEALRLPEGPGRAAYLDRACGGDSGLRRHVEALLAVRARADDVTGPAGTARARDDATAGGEPDAAAAIEPTDPGLTIDRATAADPDATSPTGGVGDGLRAAEADRTVNRAPGPAERPTTPHPDGPDGDGLPPAPPSATSATTRSAGS